MSKPKVSVFSWDMGHNALGRAYVIADLLRGNFEVEIVGAHFVNSGSEIWQPLRNAPIPMRRFPGMALPHHFRVMQSVVQELDSDILFATKPRLPSYGLAILAKELRNRPMLLDTDDRELSFFDLDSPCSLADLLERRVQSDFVKPFGRAWTQYCESIVPCADGLTVSNVSLQGLLGGTIIPHARDERVFDPARLDRPELRRRLGLEPEQRAIMFAGTPRSHKGVGEIAAALERIGDDRNRLCVFRTAEYQQVADALGPLERWLFQVPYQPFERLPETVVCADLTCVLQDPASEISRYQIPAKITDAMALGVPCLVRRLPSLEPLIEAGAVFVLEEEDDLPDVIRRILADPDTARSRAATARKVFLEEYSYAAVRPRLQRVVEQSAADPAPLSPELAELLAFLRSGFSGRALSRQPAPVDPTPSATSRWWRRRSDGRDATPPDPGPEDLRLERAERAAALAHGEAQRVLDEIRRENQALDQSLAWRDEVERARELVDDTVPQDARVAVISKGDPALAHLGTRSVEHFPGTESGEYIGHHPGSSQEAIDHLERLVVSGIDYLLVPASASWWRDQYPEFWRYLRQAAVPVGEDTRAGVVFELQSKGAGS